MRGSFYLVYPVFFDSQSENTKYNGSCSGCAKLAGRLADRLDLNNQIRRVFWELQWISWKQKSWIFSWICQYEPWNWFGIGAQWPINPHDFLAYARCFHCRIIRIFLDSSSSAAKYDNPFVRFVKFVIFVYICHTSVTHLSHICQTSATYLSHICHISVTYLYHICYTTVTFVYICQIYVTYLSNICHTYVIQICKTFVSYL